MQDSADHQEGLLGAARLVTVPNLLSLSRLVLLPVVLLLLARNQDIAALVVMAISWVTDGLDGYLARRLRQVTDLGRVLDHLVDKIWTGAVLVTLVYLRNLPLLIAAAVVLRDVLILAGSLVIMKSRGSFVSSDVLGKITGSAFALLVVYYTLNLPVLAGYKPYVDYTIGILIVVSFLNYVTVFLRRMGRFRLPADENGQSHPGS